MIDLWYKSAIIYSLDVETFQDSNADGCGDFRGLTQRLDYLAGLGVNCLWLLPFFPSPNRDNGFDITDYYNVDPRLGTLGDFVDFIHQAREHGFRVIADLVVNHTSIDHPWFQTARSDKSSKYRDYYIWSKEKPDNAHEGMVFPGVQHSVWTYDDEAGEYYFHRFYEHQPDLNIANPAVREEICRIIGFWLQLGLSGFRVDAAPFLIGQPPDDSDSSKHRYEYLRHFRDFMSWRRGDAMLLAEANVELDLLPNYFGDGQRIQMLFNFMLNQYVFLALARQKAEPIVRGLKAVAPPPPMGQYANFLRNHDELDLGRLSEEERNEVYAAFAPDPDMRLYDRGIRRRLAPMFEGDRRRLEMAYSLMCSLPGSPVLRYGDEIGMGDDLRLPERNGVRTPMQWSGGKNAAFSEAPSQQTIRPVIEEGPFGKDKVNVAAQRRDLHSLLNWMVRLVGVRRECPEIGQGECLVLPSKHPNIFAHRCQSEHGALVMVHNLSAEQTTVTLPINEGESLVSVMGGRPNGTLQDADEIPVAPYGYQWFRVVREGWRSI